MVLAASVFLTLPHAQQGHHGSFGHHNHGSLYLIIIAMVPIQLAAFAGVLALVQSQHIKIAIGIARTIAALGLALLYMVSVAVVVDGQGTQRLIGLGLVVVAELLRRAATWS